MTEHAALAPQPGPHLCAHPRCPVVVAERLLACSSHWRQLPAPIRDRVWSSRRAVEAGVASPELAENAMREALMWWEHRG